MLTGEHRHYMTLLKTVPSGGTTLKFTLKPKQNAGIHVYSSSHAALVAAVGSVDSFFVLGVDFWL